MGTIDQLNFEVILDDKEFNNKVQADIRLAQQLNTQLSNLLQAKFSVTQVSAQDAASAKRVSGIIAKQATDQEKITREKIKTSEAEERVRTQTQKTANEMEKGRTAAAKTAVAQQKLATEQNKTALAATRVENALSRSVGAQNRLTSAARRTNAAYTKQDKMLRDLSSVFFQYASIFGASQFISSVVRITGEFELQKTTLGAILGDLRSAEGILSQIKELAVESPFAFKELTTYAKQLSAFSVPAEELFQTTKMLADVSAGLGVDMNRLVLAFGQVKSAAFLRGQEVRQFTEAGIPVLEELAKQFEELEGRAISAGEVFDKISARLVPFEMIEKMFKNMTSEGGKFYKMQEIQAETLKGKVSNLKDAFEIMMNEIGTDKSDFLKNQVDNLRSLMENWKKLSAILTTVIVTYGTYKATVLSVLAVEKLLLTVQTFKKWQRFNAVLAASGVRFSKLGTLMKVFGISSAAAIAGAAAAVAALTAAIVIAIKRSNQLSNELDKIITGESINSEKSIEGLNNLMDSLKRAKQGTQEYRNIISELNRKYGEYLPKVLSEADAYDQVRIAADGAAEAIKNRARAIAFERGQEAIEKSYGKQLRNLTSDLRGTVTSLSGKDEEAAVDFMQEFNLALANAAADKDAWVVFEETFAKFFGASVLSATRDSLTQALGAEGAQDLWESYSKQVVKYGKLRKQIDKAEKQLQKDINSSIVGSTYTSFKEREQISAINEAYRTQVNNLDQLVLSQDEYNKKLKDIKVERLNALIAAYQKLGRPEMVTNYQKQLNAIQKIATGWRKNVQDVIAKLGLGESTSFGLWPKETTASTQYVEDMAKRYKEVVEQIDNIKSFDKEQSKRLDKEKKTIEAIAKILKIDIVTLSGANKKEENKEEKRLKRLIDALRKLNEQYVKLKQLGAKDTDIKNLFKELYSGLVDEQGEDFVTTFDYIERAKKLIDELAKTNPNEAKKLEVELGTDKYSLLVKDLEKINKGYKDSAKAAGEFYNELRKWATEDTDIAGAGLAFDISKIASDLQEKINEIQLRATKAKELFAQIDVNSEEEVSKVKELFTKEFGADAWTDFWNSYKKKGTKAIDDLAEAQIKYEKAVSQEKLNDLAKKTVGEMTSNLNLSDWGDKNLRQITEIQNALKTMLEGKFTVGKDTEDKVTALGLSLEHLRNEITSLLSGKYNDVVEEKIKKIQDVTKETLGIIGTIGASFQNIGEGFGSEGVVTAGEYLSVIGEIAETIADCDALWESIGEGAEIAADAATEVAKSAGSLAASLSWVTMIIKVVLIVVEQIANAFGRARAAQREIYEAALEFNELMNQQNLSMADTIFGKNFRKEVAANIEAIKNAKNALSNYIDTLAEEQDFFVSDAYLGFKKTFDLATLAKKLGYDFMGQNGEVDYDKFREFIEYYRLNKDLIENATISKDGYKVTANLEADAETAIKYLEQLEEAEKALKESTKTLFGDIADTIASNMIDAFKETGDAVSDLGKVFEDLGETILNSLLSSWVLDNILQKYEDKGKEIIEDIASGTSETVIADKLAELVDGIKKDVEAGKDFFNYLIEYFQGAGLLGNGEGGATLADGIKGITEDTANLLASYLNAIRADVSYSKTLWERMDVNLQAIASALVGLSAPSFMEYQAQIAANTYNTALHTQEILVGLRSVITADGGLSAIRVLQY